jgi:sugar phosphate isomerase/epimerase
VHDNRGVNDEHLWPGDGTIDWPAAVESLKALPEPPPTVLEIGYNLEDATATLAGRIQQAFERLA